MAHLIHIFRLEFPNQRFMKIVQITIKKKNLYVCKFTNTQKSTAQISVASHNGTTHAVSPTPPQHIATTSASGWMISFVFVPEFCCITLLWASCAGDDAAFAIAATVLESEVSLEWTWELFIPAFSHWILGDLLFLLVESLQGRQIPMVCVNNLFLEFIINKHFR